MITILTADNFQRKFCCSHTTLFSLAILNVKVSENTLKIRSIFNTKQNEENSEPTQVKEDTEAPRTANESDQQGRDSVVFRLHNFLEAPGS